MSVLRNLRQALGLNQVDFAAALGRSLQSIRNYEKGIQPPPDVMDKAAELAKKNGMEMPVDEPERAESVLRRRSARQDLAEWHELLDVILLEGDRESVRIVKENLAYFGRVARKAERQRQKRA